MTNTNTMAFLSITTARRGGRTVYHVNFVDSFGESTYTEHSSRAVARGWAQRELGVA